MSENIKNSTKKTTLGQFFTKNHFWLKKHILDFIENSNKTIAFDPFAGKGDLLLAAKQIGFKKVLGFDIDKTLNYKINDSLIKIQKIKDSIIITNPPYLAKYSASRKGVYDSVLQYFENSKYDDLYQIAIEKCLENNEYGVMIVPETFINSSFPKNRLKSITIIEDLMFDDTETPICVICFDNIVKDYGNIEIYKNDIYIGNLKEIEDMKKIPSKNLGLKFNSLNGQIALRAVDTTNINRPIQFMNPNEMDYDLTTIKVSSRLITLIEINLTEKESVQEIIDKSNFILSKFRIKTSDVLLSPFKGNKKNGERRRRLDYTTARAILEEAYQESGFGSKLF